MNVPLGSENDPRADWNHDMPDDKIEDVVLKPDGLEIQVGNETRFFDFGDLTNYDNLQYWYGDWKPNKVKFTKEEIAVSCIGEQWQGFKIELGWDEIDNLFN